MGYHFRRKHRCCRGNRRRSPNQEIAEELVVGERTVQTHITNILAKLGLSNRTQAALYALRQGIAHMRYTVDEEENP